MRWVHGPSGPMLNTMLVLKATIRKHRHLQRMKDQDTAMNYKCEIDTAVLAEKQESADVNGRWEQLKSTVINPYSDN